MPNRIRVDNVGSIGLIEDISSFELPPEAWSAVVNARMGPNGAIRFLGEEKALGTDSAALAINPLWMMNAKKPGKEYWIFMGTQKIYARSVGPAYTQTDITRAAGNYAATESLKWNGGVMQGFVVCTNNVDQPQYWGIDAAAAMFDLNNLGAGVDKWPANYLAKFIAPFGKYLITGNITKAGTNYPQLIKWSHPADPGSLPLKWDPTNPANDAGEYPLTDSAGDVVFGLGLGKQFMIYKEDCIIKMRWVGGNNIFSFDDKLSEVQGLLAPNCATNFGKNLSSHFCIGQDDVYIHNGQSVESVVEKKLRQWLFNNIDPNNYQRSFVVANYAYSEVWLCFPEIGAEQPTLALTWNWTDGSVGVRELIKRTTGGATRTTAAQKGTPCIAVGTINDTSTEPWSDPGTWDSDTSIWDSRVFSPVISRMLMADRSTSKLVYRLDSSNKFDGTDFEMSLERVGLAVTGRDRQGNWKVDSESEKLIQSLYPRLTGEAGTTVYFSIGVQEKAEDAITWSTEVPYIVGSSEHCDFYESGKIFSVRLRAPEGKQVTMLGFELEVDPIGVR